MLPSKKPKSIESRRICGGSFYGKTNWIYRAGLRLYYVILSERSESKNP